MNTSNSNMKKDAAQKPVRLAPFIAFDYDMSSNIEMFEEADALIVSSYSMSGELVLVESNKKDINQYVVEMHTKLSKYPSVTQGLFIWDMLHVRENSFLLLHLYDCEARDSMLLQDFTSTHMLRLYRLDLISLVSANKVYLDGMSTPQEFKSEWSGTPQQLETIYMALQSLEPQRYAKMLERKSLDNALRSSATGSIVKI